MADGQEERSREDLSEEASPYKVEEYRKKGMVPQSKELTSMMALLAVAVTTYVMAPAMGKQLAEFMKEVFRADLSAHLDLSGNHVLQDTLMKALKIMVSIGLPICAAGFVLGVLGSFAQIGSVFSMEPLAPDFSKLNPIAGFQRLVSIKNATDGVRMTLKILIVALVAYALIKAQVIKAPRYIVEEPGMLLSSYGQAAKLVFLTLFSILFVFSGVDFAFQRFEFGKKVRLTKAEAKQEYKEREGDPQIKARIRAAQREISRKRMMQAVKKADVIITNPTHIAIAIVYEKDMAAPRVVAKGADFVAEKIRKIALEAGVPLVENVPLARTLYKSVKVGHYIPRALYQAVAEVLAYVFKLKNKRF